jgi:thiol-disulfide isomerase/thioredoxin
MSTDFEFRRRWLQAACAVALSPWAALASAQSRGSPPLGTALDLPPLPVLSKDSWHPDQARDQVLVLYWWASWCPVCVQQSPRIQALHDAQRGAGLQVLGVSADKDSVAAQNHFQEKAYSFPCVWASPEALRAMAWVPKAVPTVWVYDRAQRLVFSESGLMSARAIQNLTRWRV